MSFFGFDSSLPRDRPHNTNAHGFGQTQDPFAGLSAADYEDDGDALDFDDTYEGYDGLGDRLEETGDEDNDATFGAGPVGKDFDFAAKSASMPLPKPQQPSQPRQQPRQPPPPSPPHPSTRPARSGYERYREPGYVPKMEASASIWGKPSQRPSSSAQPTSASDPPHSIANVTRKMMSLDEVEAMMRAQKPQPPLQPPPTQQSAYQSPAAQQASQRGPHILQRPQEASLGQHTYHDGPSQQPAGAGLASDRQTIQPLHRQHRTPLQATPVPQDPQMATMQPADRQSQPPVPSQSSFRQVPLPPAPSHSRGPSMNGRPVTHPEQLLQMSEGDRAAVLEEDAKRAKRNHKIHMLSKNNGLMTPQDKNFITRIQLQQLLTATGNVDEQGPEAALAEDFYYQVYSQIRAPRANQPLNQFAQTYLHQTAGRTGNRRGYARGGDQIRRMEQQVQRAVEAAKLKPKNKQLVLEGSLGKISFSNAKTPKPLLNLKRQENASKPKTETVASRKATLQAIEGLYSTLMRMEDHERNMPPPTTEESSADAIQEQIDWRARIQDLNADLWTGLQVLSPIDDNGTTVHPFIAILSHPKGKKIIPRIFRQIDDNQRLTILTMINIHLDSLDVIRLAQPRPDDEPLPLAVRNEIELFSQAVMPILFNYISDAPMATILGLLGLINERVNIGVVLRPKIGLGILTMILSRAELLKHAGHVEAQDSNEFGNIYNTLFDNIEPHLPSIFTTTLDSGDDMHVWQFLAALGTGASPDQQPRLVLGVKDRVMDTVTQAKQLPEDIGRPRLDNVNLFMRAIGLDVELLG